MQFADLFTRPTCRGGKSVRDLRSRRRRAPVILSLAQHGPDPPRHLVRQRDGHHHSRLARQHSREPALLPYAEALGRLDHRHGPDDQQTADVLHVESGKPVAVLLRPGKTPSGVEVRVIEKPPSLWEFQRFIR